MVDFLRQIDFGIIRTLNQLIISHDFLEDLVYAIARYGVVVFVVAGLVLAYYKRWRPILVSGLAIGLAGFANSIIHIFWNRPRPYIAHAAEIHQIGLFVQPESFPSNHAFIVFAVSTTFWITGRRKIAVYLYLVSILIVTARVAAGVHYPSDVIAGALLGIVVVPLAKQIYLLINRKPAKSAVKLT